MEPFGVIYKATNLINGKVYIGRTVRDLKERKYAHIYRALNYNTPYKFHCALRKYGEDAFVWEVIDSATSHDELNEREIYWINKYNSFSAQGYNMSIGGDGRVGFTTPKELRIKQSIACGGKEFYVFDSMGKFIRSTISCSLLAEEIGTSPANISSVIKGKKNSIKGYILISKAEFTEEELNRRLLKIRKQSKFNVYQTESGDLIGTWKNPVTCSKDLRVDRLSISHCLKGKIPSVNGYKFEYAV